MGDPRAISVILVVGPALSALVRTPVGKGKWALVLHVLSVAGVLYLAFTIAKHRHGDDPDSVPSKKIRWPES